MGMMTIAEAARSLAEVDGPGIETLRKRAQRGRLDGAQQIDGAWHVPAETILGLYRDAEGRSRTAVPPPATTAVVVQPDMSGVDRTDGAALVPAADPGRAALAAWESRLAAMAAETAAIVRLTATVRGRVAAMDAYLDAGDELLARLGRELEQAERRAELARRLAEVGA